MPDQVHIKLIRGLSHLCPDGTKLGKKPKAFPSGHPLVAYAKGQPSKFKILQSTGRAPRPPRARARRSAPAPVERNEQPDFGADLEELMSLTKKDLEQRNSVSDAKVRLRKSMSKKILAEAVFKAEQAFLDDEDNEDDDEPNEE